MFSIYGFDKNLSLLKDKPIRPLMGERKKYAVVFFSLFFLSQSIEASTLIEGVAATGIANTIQGTAQINPREVIGDVKNRVNQVVENREERDALASSVDGGFVNKTNAFNGQEKLDLRDGGIQADKGPRVMKYIRPVLIFYKKDCDDPQNCKRSSPVFTNLKSVMFHYANNRLSFQKEENPTP